MNRRPPHPECHFRMGRGLIRERKKAFSPNSILATLEFLGLTDDQKRELLQKMKATLRKPEDKSP